MLCASRRTADPVSARTTRLSRSDTVLASQGIDRRRGRVVAGIRGTYRGGCGPARTQLGQHHWKMYGHTSDATTRAAIDGLSGALGL